MEIFSKLFNKSSNNIMLVSILFIFPALLGTLIFIVIPVIFSFMFSFFDWDLINVAHFVGVNNYLTVLSNPIFLKVLSNTFTFAVSTSFFAVIIPLILACILNAKIRGNELFKTAYFLPFITPMVVIALIWQWIFDPNIGMLNYILKIHINWLYDVHFAMPALIIVSVWKLIGYNMIIFLSGLSAINQSLFDAAKIDGAGSFKIFKSITVPLLSPTIFFVVIITSISSFQVFDLIYMMTQGGPLDSTNVLVYSIYKNAFEYFKIGEASAMSYILFLIIFLLTFIQWKIRKRITYGDID